MRKSLIITIAAALLLAAVLCTAGCVDEDSIVGTYVTENDSAVFYAVFENGGTGGLVEVAEDADISEAMSLPFNWTASEAKGTYTLAYADGATDAASLDMKRGVIMIGSVEYQKVPSDVSGAMGPNVQGVVGSAGAADVLISTFGLK